MVFSAGSGMISCDYTISIHSETLAGTGAYLKLMPYRLYIKALALCGFTGSMLLSGAAAFSAEEEYGPPNLLKTLKTPFNALTGAQAFQDEMDTIGPIGLSKSQERYQRRSLAERLVIAQMYMPSRMFLGKTAPFTVKGKPGSLVAIAMADKDSGAKTIHGHRLRLGADRKVVAIGKIPEGGILVLCVETPIQGDLVGQCLYFEAALWTKPDFSDLIIATAVSPEAHQIAENGVLVASEEPQKKGLRFVADPVPVLLRRDYTGTTGLDSGKP